MNLETQPGLLPEKPGPPTLPSLRVPMGAKLAYGFGGLSDFLYVNFFAGLATQIFYLALHLDPFLLMLALAAAKLVGAICDPIVGTISDNARTRRGRRRPFILVGGLAGAVLLPFIWMPPVASQQGMFFWVLGMASIFAITYSIFSVPYGAMGYQLTTDYDERTRVLAWRGAIQTIGTLGAAWFYWLCLRPIFPNEVVGVRWVSLLISLFILGGALATVLICREKITVSEKQPSVPLGQAFALTIRNRPFLLLQSVILIMAIGLGCEGAIGNVVHIYYTCQGDKHFASLISGWGGTLTIVTSLLALPLALWISTRSGKRTAGLVGIGITLLGICLLPLTLVPQAPWLIIISWVIQALGLPAASLMFGSITADIIDEDEYENGLRREGMFCAVGGFLGKITGIFSLMLTGVLPHLAGYSDPNKIPTQHELEIMRWMLIGIQFLTLVVAIALLWGFPLTRAKSEEIRRLLDERKRSSAEGSAA